MSSSLSLTAIAKRNDIDRVFVKNNYDNDEQQQQQQQQLQQQECGLGFSSSLVQRIASSRAKMATWVELETTLVNAAWERYRQKVKEEQAVIDDQVANLLSIQLERGLNIVPNNETTSISGNEENHPPPASDLEGRSGGVAPVNGSIAKRMLVRQHQADQLRTEITCLERDLKAREQQLQEVEKLNEHHRVRAEEMTAQKEEAEALKEASINDLMQIINKYRHVGLCFEKAENERLRFWFTQLDAGDPSRAFSFLLSANDKEMYVVEECQPLIDDKVLKELVEYVNATDDLSYFIRGMRKAFAATN